MLARRVYQRTQFLWQMLGVNRHEQEPLTPSLHAETYSPDSDRSDLLPFLHSPLTSVYQRVEAKLAKIGGNGE